MFSSAIGFVLGVLWVQHSANLYPLATYMVGSIVGRALARLCPPLRPLALVVFGVALGAGYATWRAEVRLDARLPDALDRTSVHWKGTVTGLPLQVPGGVRFQFKVDSDETVPVPLDPVALSWFPPPEAHEVLAAIKPGARLAMGIRLRRSTSLFNPGGFDHAGRDLAKGLAGRGYVLDARVLGPPDSAWVDGRRFELREWIIRRAPETIAGPLVAMALGEQRYITDSQWDIFRATGTAHLVAISGLHVSIVAGMVGLCVAFVWRRIPTLANRWPTRNAALLAGLLAVSGYAALAGFGIPVTRALIMVAVAVLAVLSGRRVAPFRTLLLAMVCVLLFDPWAVLSPGFWLSFGAVAALLIILQGRHGKRPRWGQFLLAQWAITWLTLPVVLGVFGGLAMVSPVANLIAIPWISLVIVPSLLLASVGGSELLLAFAGWHLEQLLAALAWLAQFNPAVAFVLPPLWLCCVACLLMSVALLPRGTPVRWLLAASALPLFLWRPEAVPIGTARMTVLDVGQGLSVLIETQTHRLLYDTGRGYYRGGDAGRSVVLPALASMGINRIDMLVLSHDDNDHVGGAPSIAAALPVSHVVGGEGVSLDGFSLTRCHAGEHWHWDGVLFEWLYPARGASANADNDRSCVLRIGAGGPRAVLTGDITDAAEASLVANKQLENTTVVVAPHHGSKSSSSPGFVRSVRAAHVIFSAGYRNAYGHPAPSVVERWRASGASTWNTADTGAVTVMLGADDAVVTGAKAIRLRYWHRQ